MQHRLVALGKQSNLLGKDCNGDDQDLTMLVDGSLPSVLMQRVKDIYREVELVDSWRKWCAMCFSVIFFVFLTQSAMCQA
jgi:hypothetical protein